MKLDRTTLIGIAICLLLLLLYKPMLQRMGLGRYFEPQRGATTSAVDSTRRNVPAGDSALASQRSAPGPVAGARGTAELTATPKEPPPALERVVTMETPLYKATFSNFGARLISVELKRYAAAHGVSSVGGKPRRHRPDEEVPPGDRVVLAGGPLLAIDLGADRSTELLKRLMFTSAESLDAAGQVRTLSFTATDSSGIQVREIYRVRPDQYALDLDVEIRNVPSSWHASDYSLSVRSWPLQTESDQTADERALRASSLLGANLHREHAGALIKGSKRFDGNALWSAVQSRYFIGAVAVSQSASRAVISSAERRNLPPAEVERLPRGAKPYQDVAINTLVVGMPSEHSPVHRYVVYTGPCDYFALSVLKLNLERAVDLGWSWVLPFSRALLFVLNWLNTVVRNYGLAIILLATLVRLLLHPLNMLSMKSMRSMQKLQPEMERIKEKYKNDPQAQNTAIMALYKDNKVNPAGGCLPMLIQMPFFISLYQVLFNAIELRQAPFAAWVIDLSAPDLLFTVASFPIRLLPLLMLGSGILSQRVTPTDPRQLPTMYMMNVMMLVFFYNLPSGLVLYWTVMNVLTAIQQWMVLRQDGGALAVPVAVPEAGPRRGPAARRAR